MAFFCSIDTVKQEENHIAEDINMWIVIVEICKMLDE